MKYTEEQDKVSYCLGLSIASNLITSGVKTLNAEPFVEALDAAFNGKMPEVSPEEANAILQEFFGKMQEEQAEKAVGEGQAFLEENKKNEGVVTLESGLQYQIITEGNGDKPKATDSVKCHYHGTLINGTVFDSSVDRGEPATFPVNGVIAGWVEALQLMPLGSKWKLVIPSNLAYGAQGAGNLIGPHTTLIFEVELLEIV
ncbi:FKBP-type peptidyl-prolyl cis-trans isomerase [Ancylomarina sp. DW003]|uniref:Peptidyl-prolyl cis-trans isomerase n=1 Tax=Paralabilibaculum antarcticum TaxID=2912572 RepID=A0ABT5VTL3_9BACT|nr:MULTISPECIES: FKBP-type peptidyl-prolyl cis-trans isomerase [Marinifilaceae]MDE5418765.1 FKBP-type peptidyl-prolyl cis-trans isomerase [Labilibaculum sp. DW002]MDE5421405.1 FKBP-type peptidyl-prolyl cis-trans isomerase [Ancylomarina sp. DW003]